MICKYCGHEFNGKFCDNCGRGENPNGNTAVETQAQPQPQNVSNYQNFKTPHSRNTALILCICLGFLGIHRFYVGKTGTGILWFLTCGCFVFGWLIDAVTIYHYAFLDANNEPVL